MRCPSYVGCGTNRSQLIDEACGNWQWDTTNDTVTWGERLHRIAGRDPGIRGLCPEQSEKWKIHTEWVSTRLPHHAEIPHASERMVPYRYGIRSTSIYNPDTQLRSRGRCQNQGRRRPWTDVQHFAYLETAYNATKASTCLFSSKRMLVCFGSAYAANGCIRGSMRGEVLRVHKEVSTLLKLC
jgi:hypothetical protein